MEEEEHTSPQPVELVIERIKEAGCVIKTLDGNLTGPYGETERIRYAENPLTKEHFYLNNIENQKMLSPAVIRNIERRLEIDLRFAEDTEKLKAQGE